MGQDIQPALRGQLLTLLRHQAHVRRAVRLGDTEHLLGNGHFEVDPRIDLPAQGFHLLVLNVTAVFSQMHRDGIGAGAFGGLCRLQHGGIIRSPRLANGRYVVDIDAQQQSVHGPFSFFRKPRNSAWEANGLSPT